MYQNRFRSQTWTAVACASAALAAMLNASSASADAAKDTAKCIATISKATAGYEIAVQKALGKCEDAKAKEKVTACPDAKATAKISGALTKLQGSITKDCGAETVASVGFDGLVKRCTGGANDGQACTINTNCNGACAGGAEVGAACTSNANCPALCVGGTQNGTSCKGPGAGICTAGGGNCTTNVGTCTGPAPGTCDPKDRCPATVDYGTPFGSCDAVLASIADVNTCVACNAEAVAEVATGWAWNGRRPAADSPAFGVPNSKDDAKASIGCQRFLGKAAGKYFQSVLKATQKCTAGLLAGKVPSCPDSKLTDALTKAKTKLASDVNKKCGGNAYALTFLGTSVLANGPTLAPFKVPNNAAGFIDTTDDLFDTLTSCSDNAAAPSLLTVCQSLCGNSQIDPGEECDDGNRVNGDFCSSDCQRTPCTVTGTVTATVDATLPTGVTPPLGALVTYVTYNQAKLSLPGNGTDGGLRTTSNSFTTAVNDLDYAVRVVQVDPADIGLPYTIDFDVCSGAVVTSADVQCMVETAAQALPAVDAYGVTCSVTVP